MNYAAAEAALCEPGERLSRIQRCALRACVRAWPQCYHATNYVYGPDELRENAAERMREEVKNEYGFAIATFILLTIAGAALSWLIERILSRLFPESGYGCDHDFAAQLTEWSRA